MEELLLAHVVPVLNDAVDQFAILGACKPAQLSAPPPLPDDEVGELVRYQRMLEAEYDALLNERDRLRDMGAEPAHVAEHDEKMADVVDRLKQSTESLVKALRERPGIAQHLSKVQRERRFAQDCVSKLAADLVRGGGVGGFVAAVAREQQRLADLQARVQQDAQGGDRLKELRARLEQEVAANEQELAAQRELIADLKDELQETKMRISVEGKYIKKESAARVTMQKTRTKRRKEALGATLADKQTSLDNEIKVHEELVDFLTTHYHELTEKLDVWVNKFDTDTQVKLKELETLKSNRARDLSQLQELSERFKEYEQVVKQDRQRKEEQRRAAERALVEMAAAVRIQSWWRGTLVRKGGVKKKASAKGGKKGSKKKKKK